MEIFIWIVLIISGLLAIGINVLLYSVTNEDNYDEQGPIYVYLLNHFFIGILFLVSNYIDSDISLFVWKAGNIVSILNLLFCTVLRIRRVHTHWIIVLVISLLIGVIPYFINPIFISGKSFAIFDSFNNNYPQIIVSFWIPLFVIISILFIYFNYTFNAKKNIRIKDNYTYRQELRRLDEELYYSSKRDKPSDFESKLFSKFYEDLQYSLDRNLKRNEELYYRQRELLEPLLKYNLHPLDNGNSDVNNQNNDLIQLLNLLNSKLDNISPSQQIEKGNYYSNLNNQNFIRELHHYLLTPLSQIESKTILFSQNDELIYNDKEKFKKAISTIATSVEICKSVLIAYRELAFVTSSSSEWSPKSLNSSLISAGNLYKESYEKDVMLESEILDDYPGYSNNYLLAVLLPLLENAIKASPKNEIIKIKSDINTGDNYIIITIENKAINIPTIENLNTPGFSSKKNHKGTGLMIARHLIQDQNNGLLSFQVADSVISIISLPKRII